MADRQIFALTADTTPDRTDVIPKQDAAGGTEAQKSTLAQVLALAIVADLSDASANGRSLISAANYAAMRTLLGLVIGTNVQAWSAILDDLAGLTQAANKLPYFDGASTAALADLTAAGRALLDDADAAAQRTTITAPGYTAGDPIPITSIRCVTESVYAALSPPNANTLYAVVPD